MGFSLSELIKRHSSFYYMPDRFLEEISDENLNHISLVSLILWVLGLINIVTAVVRADGDFSGKAAHFIYYGISFATTFIAFIWTRILLQKKDTVDHRIKSLPLYLGMIGMQLAFIMNFWPDGEIFSHYNGFVLLACEGILTGLFFHIYPNLFDLIHLPFIIATFMIEIEQIGLVCASNILVYFVILHILVVYKWANTKEQFMQREKMAALNANLSREIDIAADIQKNFYTCDVSNIYGWELGYYNKAMAGVSGDLFAFYKRENILDGLGIFDVSGHGISSGLLTMLAKNIIEDEFYSNSEESLDQVLYEINDRIIEAKGNVENYLTGILSRLKDNKLEFVNAGHPLPLVYTRKDDNLELFIESPEERYGVIGLKDFPTKYQVESFDFSHGDEMIFYSDGIIDAVNSEGEEFGHQRFMECVKKYVTLKPKDQVNFISEEVRLFQGRAAQKDDVTLIIIKKA